MLCFLPQQFHQNPEKLPFNFHYYLQTTFKLLCNSMDGHSEPDPSNVCKILNEDDCNSIMQIPSRLVKSYGDNLPRFATLKVDDSGNSWRVGIEKFKGHYFFTDGWEKFAKDVDVESRKVLHFKSPSSPIIRPHNSNSEEGNLMGDSGSEDTFGEEEEEGSGGAGIWSFSEELQKHHAYRLNVRKDFVKGTGIDTNREIKLLDEKNKRWPVLVIERKGRFYFGTGWNDFLVGNKVVVGSTIDFEFISIAHNMIITKIVKVGMNKKELFKFVKRGSDGKFEFLDSPKSKRRARSSHQTSKINDKDDSIDTYNESGSGVCKRLKFSKELTKQHAYGMTIPNEFTRETGIETMREIKLVDQEGREWPIEVKYWKCSIYRGVYAMVGGWKDFLVANEAGIGTTVSFKWISDNLIKAKVVNNGRKGNSRFAKKARGRPPVSPR